MIPVNEPLLNGNEKKYLNECIDTGWISSEGPFIKKFEDTMANYTGRKHAIAVSNGSVALDAAVVSMGVKPGDEVILPTFTIISCAAAIVRAGAIPVVVDCDPNTYNIDVSQIEKKITNKTKAIMVVHIYGLPCDMDPILAVAKKYNLKIIEDAAEMHGQTYKDKKCGSFGDISTFSFYPNKHITTGEGGMILTDDDQVAIHCRSLRNLCFKPEKRFVHDELGWNFRMTNLQAALGVAQLERINEFVEKKRWMGKLYNEKLKDISAFQLAIPETDYAKNIYWVFPIVLKSDFKHDAESFCKLLGAKGIGTRPFFWNMHEQPVLLKNGLFKNEKLPHAENIARRGFYIPSGLAITEKQIDEVVMTLRDLI
ncbi:MAG: DegT/DnrJ/EryC1/StrS family aminotransferase [Bacteriovoracaceae bacterium]|nr:DegT/DnrJ/EryC1/StrS family aminotransferase [Bacteriovoracaceae bacterium]